MQQMRPYTIVTTEQSPSIPNGKAIIIDGADCFVGTDNGFPKMGRPALFPVDQAIVIATTLNMVFIGMGKEHCASLMSSPDEMPKEFWEHFELFKDVIEHSEPSTNDDMEH